jgi:hypothetical protein
MRREHRPEALGIRDILQAGRNRPVRVAAFVTALIAALLCQAPAVYCSGPDEGRAYLSPDLPGNHAQDLFAFQPPAPRGYTPARSAPDFTHSFSFLSTGVWGTASNRTVFSTGMSRLDWPMNFGLVGGLYRAGVRGLAEWDLSIQACPWTRSMQNMEDYDLLKESRYGYASHEGIDIYSESTTDSKAFILGTGLRVFALSLPYADLGVFLGYENQEMDFKTYNVRQTGYGPWAPLYTVSLTGPGSTYTLNYEFYSLGLTWRLEAGEQASLTLDAAFIPYASVSDEDEHLRRYRESKTTCDGTGSMLSMNGQFALTGKWFVSSSCSLVSISADGYQKQFWWGNDPGSAGDETGTVLGGIDAHMEQDSFRIGLALGCRL